MTPDAATVESVRQLLVKYWPYSDRMATEVVKLIDAAVREERERHASKVADPDGHVRCHECMDLLNATRRDA